MIYERVEEAVEVYVRWEWSLAMMANNQGKGCDGGC